MSLFINTNTISQEKYDKTIISDNYVINVSHFNKKLGLSSNSVNDIFKDIRNIYWIGTDNGLNRFDGKQFKLISKSEDNLLSDEIASIEQDGDGLLWLMHNVPFYRTFVGVTIFDPKINKVIDIETHFGEDFPLDFSKHFYPYKGPGNSLYIMGFDGTIIHYVNKENYKILGKIPLTNSVVNYITNLFVEKDGSFWANIPGYLNKYDVNCNLIKEANHWPEQLITYLNDEGIYNRFFIKNNEYKKKIFTFDSDLKVHHIEPEIPKGLKIVYFDTQMDLYILTNTEKMYLFDEKNGELVDLITLPREGDSDFFLRYVVKLGSTYWVISPFDGFYTISLGPKKFNNIHTKKQQRGIVVDYQNQLWLNNSDGVFDNAEPNFLFSKEITAFPMLLSSDSCIWKFGYDNQLIRYAPPLFEKKIYRDYCPIPYLEWCMFEDSKNRIWFFDDLSYFDIKKEQFFQLIELQKKNPIGLQIKHFIHESSNGDLWIGTDNGLFQFDPDKGFINKYGLDEIGAHYLPTNKFHHLFIDKEEIWWIVTDDIGLLRWDKKNNSFKQYSYPERFPSNKLHAIYEGIDEKLWINSEDGIICWDKESEYARVYNVRDGILHAEGNRNSHFKDHKGKIHFGSVIGLTNFDPLDFSIKTKQKLRKIEILDIKRSSKEGELFHLESYLEPYFKHRYLSLEPGENYAEIYFVPIEYLNLDQYIFSFKYANKNTDWIRIEGNKLTISNLSYGDHFLEVKAQNINGIITKPFYLKIKVERPYYLQAWFIMVILLLLIIVIWLYTGWRTLQLKKQKLNLEQQIKKGTKEIFNKNIDIEEKNKQLAFQTVELKRLDKLKSRLFANVSHELRTPLTLIQGPINYVLNSKTLSVNNTRLLKKANENTKTLNLLINEILDLTKLEAGQMKLDLKPTYLFKSLSVIISNFKLLAERQEKAFSMNYKLDTDLLINLDFFKFEKIINNLLSNAFKFTASGDSIEIIVSQKEELLIIGVSDTGRGIEKVDLPFVFDRYYQSDSNLEAEGGTGIGLAICAEYAKLFSGKVWVNSVVNVGSIFYLEFPMEYTIIPIEDQIENNFDVEEKEKSKPIIDTLESSSDIVNKQRKSKILVVEDHKDIRDFLSFILEDRYEIILAENGLNAISYLSSTDRMPDLIISDIMMPIMDGYQFIERLRSEKTWLHIPIIMLTARASLGDKLKALHIGVDDYIVKPFDTEELLVRIKNILGNRAQRSDWIEKESDKRNVCETTDWSSISSKDKYWLKDLEKVVTMNISNINFGVEELAEKVLLGRTQLYRKTKRITGLSPNIYIREVRLQRARELLEAGAYKSIKEVSLKVGIQKPSYFATIYKKRFGKLPTE